MSTCDQDSMHTENDRLKSASLHPGGHALTMDGAAAAGMSGGDTVLDIGCGNASSLVMLRKEFGIIPYGADNSENAIRSAQNAHPDITLACADAKHLPYPDDFFDHVMMECVLTLLSDPEASLSEAVRVLKNGGHLIISTLSSTDDDTVTDDGDIPFCRNGLVLPHALTGHLKSAGLEPVLSEDRKADLTQYMVDSIMEYGSLEERIRMETESLGGSVFDCDHEYDRKTTSYHLFVFRKGKTAHNDPSDNDPGNIMRTGTPVDELAAERIGVDPEDLTQETVERYQAEAFRRTMKYAKDHSRFYGSLFADFDPDDIHSLSDIQALPATSESDLAGNEWQFQCLPASDIDRTVTVPALEPEHTVTLPTSGTSGKSKRIVFTSEDQERSVEFINCGFLTQRCARGERMLVFMSGTTEGSIGDLVMRAMAPLEMDIRVYGAVKDISDAYDALMEFRPGVVEALPWHAAALARYGTKYGNPEKDFIRSVNLSADVVPDSIVDRLEKLWGCTVHRHYGTTEMAIFGGVECEYHRGYHTRPCDILYEIPETDDSGYGELLITTFDRKAMPLLRYRTGDIARFIDTPCPCGCKVRRIERFLGRKSSLIDLSGSSFYLSELADAIYTCPEVIDFDVIEQTSEKTIRVIVRTLPDESVSDEEVRKTLMKISGLSEAVINDKAVLILETEKTSHFPSGYNLKKKVIRL